MRVRLRDGEVEMPVFSQISENLWQAGCPQNGLPLPGRFAHVINLAGVPAYRAHHVLMTSTVVDMADSSDQSMDIVDPLARLVADLAATSAVLVNCLAGLNRSGVVVARALMHRGLTADEAIATVRARRHERALYNEHFVTWLHENPLH
ncbi:dual specificity protein phosphatase family protein [Gordonia defluvii]